MLFTVEVDDGGEVFYGCVDVSEVTHVEVCEGGGDVVGEGVPVCSVVVGEDASRWDVKWSV